MVGLLIPLAYMFETVTQQMHQRQFLTVIPILVVSGLAWCLFRYKKVAVDWQVSKYRVRRPPSAVHFVCSSMLEYGA